MIKLENQNDLRMNWEWDEDMQPILEEEKEAFLSWFFDNASIYTVSEQHDSEILDNENILASRCFGNSQLISNEYDKQYAEGYILGNYGKYLPHGFNIKDNLVQDYTLKKLENYTLPIVYYGIEIPHEYFTNDDYSNYGNQSFIMDYFRDQLNS